jgi:hypothetical protein
LTSLADAGRLSVVEDPSDLRLEPTDLRLERSSILHTYIRVMRSSL